MKYNALSISYFIYSALFVIASISSLLIDFGESRPNGGGSVGGAVGVLVILCVLVRTTIPGYGGQILLSFLFLCCSCCFAYLAYVKRRV